MTNLNFEINNQHLKLKNVNEYVVNKSDNYLKLFFNFNTHDWDDKTCFCLLKNSEHTTFQFSIPGTESVKVPDDVLIGDYFEVSVYGATANERITTNIIRIHLTRSGYTDSISSISGSTDVFLDVTNRMDELEESISDVGKSGSFNDLLDVPETFTPNEHTHCSNEILDLDSTIEVEIKQAYRVLSNKIRSYGA